MSYILEALKKSDAERKRGAVPTLGDTPQTQNTPTVTSGKPWPWFLAGGFGLVALIGVSVLALMGRHDGASAPQAQQVVKSKAQREAQPAPKPEPITKVETPVSVDPAPTPIITAKPKPVLKPAVKKRQDTKPSPPPCAARLANTEKCRSLCEPRLGQHGQRPIRPSH